MGAAISAIIPTYNAEPYIEETLRSVVDQTRPADEIIVVDDGSRDRTVDIVRAFGHGVRLVTQENAGVCVARNRGAAASCGEWLAFLDADDVWAPGKLAAQAAIFERHPGVGLVATDFDEIDAEGRPIQHPMKQPVHVYGKAMNMHRELLHAGNVLAVSASVVRRDAFEAVGGFFTERRILSGDYDLWIRLSEAHDFYIVPEVLCHYRILEESAIHGSLSREFGAQRNIIEMHRHRFSDAEYRARLARLHADWADSALFDRAPDAWKVWRRALSLDPARGRLWAMGARAAARRLLKPRGP